MMLRSTVKIGTTRNVVGRVLEASGKRFDLAMCPERTLEGKAMEELRRLPQIVGSDTPEARERAVRFYYRLTPTVIQMDRYEAAETFIADEFEQGVRIDAKRKTLLSRRSRYFSRQRLLPDGWSRRKKPRS